MSRRLLPLLIVMIAAGCAAWRIWGEIPVTPAAPPVFPEVAQVSAERRKAALFYSDLGPNEVDITAYPPEHKSQYEVYVKVCSSCHTLARSINSPYVSRAWWEFYIASMRMRAHFHRRPLNKNEIRAVVDFLEYDSNERKVARAPEFEATKFELKRRFETALDERMQELQRKSERMPPR
jgi:hypothetical protein